MFFKKKNSVHVRTYKNDRGETTGALLSFNGVCRDDILKKFQENYALEGDHIKTGGALAPGSMLTLIGSGTGALGISAAMSGSLFVATANPATLMAIGNGVGSAVMGAGGIVAQAPFIPVAGAMMPVIAPLLAFQAITSIMMLNQFSKIHKRLDQIEKSIHRLLQRTEATYVGEIISAANRLEELEHQFSVCNRFTNDMIIKLALIEDKVNPIFERYQFLFRAQGVNKYASGDDLSFKKNDSYFSIVLSMLDLRIELMQLRLTLQENPGYLKYETERLEKKVNHYRELWNEITGSSSMIEDVARTLAQAAQEMGWWKRNLFNRSEHEELENKASTFKKVASQAEKDLHAELEQAKLLADSIENGLEQSEHMNLIYWRDEQGEHAYYTSDLDLQPVSR